MNISVTSRDESSVVAIVGRLDSTTSSSLEDWAKQFIDSPKDDIVMDFSQLEYISSAGLRVILNLAKAMKKFSRRFSICNTQEQVREVFEISGFDTFIPIFDSLEECL